MKGARASERRKGRLKAPRPAKGARASERSKTVFFLYFSSYVSFPAIYVFSCFFCIFHCPFHFIFFSFLFLNPFNLSQDSGGFNPFNPFNPPEALED